MNYQNVKGTAYVVLSGIVLLAIVLLVILQWGNNSDFSLYGKNVQANTAVLMVLSAVGGFVLWWTAKWMITGVGIMRLARRAEASEQPRKTST
ncbi:MAG: hypothetical protein SVT52_02725 [Planctomycetota bacterium]|nr:hypothetical protein [Planctomycetota bacterium]